MSERIVLVLLFLYLLLNLPFPNIVIEKIPQNQDEIQIDYDPITSYERASIEVSGNPDSIKVDMGNYSETVVKTTIIELPINPGINDIHLMFFKGKKVISKNLQIYKPQDKFRVAFVTSKFTPTFKVLNSFALRKGIAVVKPYIMINEEWLTLDKNNLIKVKNPEFSELNAIIVNNESAQRISKKLRTPLCLIPDGEKNLRITKAFVVSDRYKLRVDNIVIYPVQKEIKDTILWLEPNKAPIFFLGQDGNFYLNIENFFELYLKSPEIIDSILTTVLENIAYPKFKLVKLNETFYLIFEPPNLPERLLLEVTKNDQKIPITSIIKGYLPIKPEKEIDTLKITAKTSEKVFLDTTLVLHKKNENTRKIVYKTKVRFKVAPSQSSFLFLILLFTYTALIYTFGRIRRQKDEDG